MHIGQTMETTKKLDGSENRVYISLSHGGEMPMIQWHQNPGHSSQFNYKPNISKFFLFYSCRFNGSITPSLTLKFPSYFNPMLAFPNFQSIQSRIIGIYKSK